MDKIIIKDLTFSCIVGILDFERHIPQQVRINAELYLDLQDVALKQDLSLGINYQEAIVFIQDFVRQRREGLLESLIYQLALALVQKYTPLMRVKLRIEKLHIIKHALVGIEIDKTRTELCQIKSI